MRLAPGDRVGRYLVTAPIGAGGMGEVYRARDDRLARDVALKILPASFAADADRLSRFEREAQAVGRLNHPNVVSVYDAGTDNGTPFLVSELLEGETLRSALARGPLAAAPAVDHARQLARGLGAAHDQGIVHRDLKPENVFITTDGRLKILDFGIAKVGASAATPASGTADATTVAALTEQGVTLGTVGYMSPEQIRGEVADARADLFAFGVILFELLSGRRPFSGPTAMDTMSAVLRDEAPDLAAAGVPPALDRIVRRCLQKRPGDRFQSARDLEYALTEVTAGAPVRRRMPWRAVAVGAAVVAVTLAARSVLWHPGATASSPPRITSIAVLPLQNLSPDPAQEFFVDGVTVSLISTLDRVSALRVISQTSVMSYKGAKKPLRDIARDLKVDAVVEGSVVRDGGTVRIVARLVDARTEAQIWTNTYDRDVKDVLAVQAEIARSIAQEIRVALTADETKLLTTTRVVVPAAHESYLRGRYFLDKGTEPFIHKALEEFRKASDADPLYAPPHAGRADALTALRSMFEPPKDVMPEAKAAAQKALDLDETLAEAHVSMGGVLMYYEFDWARAEAELRRAIALSPSLAIAHDSLALYLAAVGRQSEAVAESARARELDPLSLQILNNAGWIAYLGHQWDGLIEANQKAIDIDASYWPALRDLGLGFEKRGDFPKALATLKRASALDRNPSIGEMLGGVYAALGHRANALKVIADLTAQSRERYVCPYEVATIHACLGDKDKALELLTRAYEERADCFPWSKADAKLDSLRDDARFQALMRRSGLAR